MVHIILTFLIILIAGIAFMVLMLWDEAHGKH